MCVHHHLIGDFEVTILTHRVSLDTLHGHVLLQLFLRDGLLAVERTLDVHMLAVILVSVHVSVQLTQHPRPATLPSPHASVHLETNHLSLIFVKPHGKFWCPYSRQGLSCCWMSAMQAGSSSPHSNWCRSAT